VRAAAIGRSVSSPALLALAATVPLVFLHVSYQPGFHVGLGSTSAHVTVADLGVLVSGALAAAVWARSRTAARPAAGIAAAAAAFLVWIFAACFYPLLGSDPYRWHTHLVTAGKFAEYALLAASVLVLVRRRLDLDLLAAVVAVWSAAATVVGLLQFGGLKIAAAWPAGHRQPSFLGHQDFAALSGAAASLALVAIALPQARVDRRLATVGGVGGAVGLILAGSSAAAIGFALAAAAAALVTRRSLRRVLAIAAIAAVVGAGVALLRGGDIASFLHFLGLGKQERQTSVETYTQRTLLAYIGWRIFLDHPVVGVGWEGSTEEWAYGPQLPAAHRAFPDAVPLSFPSPRHPWGVQNAYVQALSDLGAVGAVLLLGLLGACLVVAGRRALRAPPEGALVALLAACWLLVAIGTLAAIGLIAGLPTDGLLWLAIGLAAAAAAGAPQRAAAARIASSRP
jgi:O-antigen ligase